MNSSIQERLRPAAGGAGRLVVRAATSVAEGMAPIVGGARRALRFVRRRTVSETVRRRRRLRALSKVPVPSLYERHPEVRSLVRRQLGLRAVPVDEIVGTAVAGATQRAADFLPLPAFRSANWTGRWQRVRAGIDRLAVLPPVDLLKYAEGYWVEDGHNRVAGALYAGQVAVDASVTELVPPGAARTERPTSLAAELVGSAELRLAGEGGTLGVPGRGDT